MQQRTRRGQLHQIGIPAPEALARYCREPQAPVQQSAARQRPQGRAALRAEHLQHAVHGRSRVGRAGDQILAVSELADVAIGRDRVGVGAQLAQEARDEVGPQDVVVEVEAEELGFHTIEGGVGVVGPAEPAGLDQHLDPLVLARMVLAARGGVVVAQVDRDHDANRSMRLCPGAGQRPVDEARGLPCRYADGDVGGTSPVRRAHSPVSAM